MPRDNINRINFILIWQPKIVFKSKMDNNILNMN